LSEGVARSMLFAIRSSSREAGAKKPSEKKNAAIAMAIREVHSIPSLHRNHRPKSYASHGPLGSGELPHDRTDGTDGDPLAGAFAIINFP
jgi:hypothetical protein